jgi:hypothetical protein
VALTLNLQTQRSSGALVLNLAPPGDSRTVVIAGRTRCRGLIRAGQVFTAVIAGRTRCRGLIRAGQVFTAVIAGRTRCRGRLAAVYDPNLLSAVHALAGSPWNEGERLTAGRVTDWNDSEPLPLHVVADWQPAESIAPATVVDWQSAAPLAADTSAAWQDAALTLAAKTTTWDHAAPAQIACATDWQSAALTTHGLRSDYRPRLPLLAPALDTRWNDAASASITLHTLAGDGAHIDLGWRTLWNDAGLAYNAWTPRRPPRPKPPKPTQPPILNLRHYRPPGPLILNLGASRARWYIPDLRCYSVLNTCAVVRLPDRTPLPATTVTLETNDGSWAWNLTLTLLGADGWALCQPDPLTGLPREVEVTINGIVWAGLLDDPVLARKFNSHAITAQGMSRSGWLAAPFAPATTVSYAAPRSAQQVAEAILDGTGWTLDWQLPLDPGWLIPANHYAQTGTPMERLAALVAAVKGGLYSDPADYTLTAYPRYSVMPWAWDESPVEVEIPAAALLAWNQRSADRTNVNRVYVSGTTAGVLLRLTRDGTAGDLAPAAPIVDAMLTDVYVARARGEAELAAGGPGFEATVETLLGGDLAFPLVRPGLLCEFAGIRGISRSCKVSATWTDKGLAVWQTIGIERRTGPWL